MIKVIAGLKGSGKTKILIDMVNDATSTEKGDIVCIENQMKLTYDINYRARLIQASQYNVNSFQKFYGFISGIVASNYDLTSIFIDSIYKICGYDPKGFVDFIYNMEELFKSFDSNIRLVLTVTEDVTMLPDEIKKYI